MVDRPPEVSEAPLLTSNATEPPERRSRTGDRRRPAAEARRSAAGAILPDWPLGRFEGRRLRFAQWLRGADELDPQANVHRPLVLTAAYVAVGVAWILGSSILAAELGNSLLVELAKGVLFVVVTGGLLLLVLLAHERQSSMGTRRLRQLIESGGDVAYRYRRWPTPGFDYISEAITSWTGLTPREHYDNPDIVFHLVHPDDRRRLTELLTSGSTGSPVTLRWVTPEQRILHTQHDVRAVLDRRGRMVALDGRIRNVTSARRDLAEAEVGIATLGWLAEGLETAPVLQRTLVELTNLMEVDVAWVGMPLADGSVAPVAAVGEPTWVEELDIRWDEGPLANGPTGIAIRERRAVTMTPEGPGYAPWRQAASAVGVTSSLAVPIVWNTSVVGVLNLYARFGNPFDDRQVERFERVALRLAFALGNPRGTLHPAGRTHRRSPVPAGLDIAAAIHDGRVETWWQPQVAASDGRIVAAEALVRIRQPSGELVLPAVILPAAETAGLLQELGRVMRRQALTEARGWLKAGLDRICVNVSVAELVAPGFETEILDLLGAFDLRPDQLEIELVETAPIDTRTIRVLAQLSIAGVRIAVDDYGSGWASLGHLAQVPASVLKIDRVFVRELGESDRALALVASTLELGRALGLTTVAEGVETAAQVRLLAELGCDLLQGFLFSPPVETAGLTAMLRTGTPVHAAG